MNKADPDDIVQAFQDRTRSALHDWQLIDDAVRPLGVGIRRRVACDAFLALAVSWESTLSTWLIGAVNKDTSAAIQHLEQKVRDHAETNLGLKPTVLSASLIATSHLNLSDVRSVLDPNDKNITIRDQKALTGFGNKWLAGTYKRRALALSAFDFAPAVVVRVVRNALAHQSDAAVKEANSLVSSASIPVALRHTASRSISASGWGRYLLATTVPTPRISTLHHDLINLTGKLHT